MPLDPTAKAIMDAMDTAWPDLGTVTAAEARQVVKQAGEAARALVPPPEVARVEDRTVPGPAGEIPVRIYWPRVETPPASYPMVVYFHGGGWVICDLDSHDNICRSLSNATGAVVVSVDYRLAPEHKYPAAADDAYAATVWAAGHAGELGADPTRVAIAGDSAGGNLTAVVALMARDRGGPALRYQMMIYPVTDISPGHQDSHPSKKENGTGYFLTTEHMDWFRDQYLPDGADGSDPYISPLLATDLSGLPPAFVITAEYDPLRDEGEMYGARMRDAGVPVDIRRYDGVFHGFFSMAALLPIADTANRDAADALRHALH
jgi:acetyl esterase